MLVVRIGVGMDTPVHAPPLRVGAKALRRRWAVDDLFFGPTLGGTRCYTRPMPKRPNSPQNAGFVLGRAAFDRISAVEGLRRDETSEAMFTEFDRRGLDAEARRQAIRARHGANFAGPALRRRTSC